MSSAAGVTGDCQQPNAGSGKCAWALLTVSPILEILRFREQGTSCVVSIAKLPAAER